MASKLILDGLGSVDIFAIETSYFELVWRNEVEVAQEGSRWGELMRD